MANSVDNNGPVNNNIFFSMREAQPDSSAIGGLGDRKMRLIISDRDLNPEAQGVRPGGFFHSQQNQEIYNNARKVEVAAVLLKDASFWDKASVFLGLSKRVTILTAGNRTQEYLLNINSVAKRLGITRDEAKNLTGEKIRNLAQSKLYPPTQLLHTQPPPTQPRHTQPLHNQPPPNRQISNMLQNPVPNLNQFLRAEDKDKALIFHKLPYETKKELITQKADHFDYIPFHEQLGIFSDLSPDTQKKIVSKFPLSILNVDPNSISNFINDLSIDDQAAIIEAIPNLFNRIKDSNKRDVFLKLQNAKFQVIANNLENPTLKINQSNPEFGIDKFNDLDPSDKKKVIDLNFAFFFGLKREEQNQLFSQLSPKTQAYIIDAPSNNRRKIELFNLVSDNEKKSNIIGNLIDLETGTTKVTINGLIRATPTFFESYGEDRFKQSLFNQLSLDVQGILIQQNASNNRFLPSYDRRQS